MNQQNPYEQGRPPHEQGGRPPNAPGPAGPHGQYGQHSQHDQNPAYRYGPQHRQPHQYQQPNQPQPAHPQHQRPHQPPHQQNHHQQPPQPQPPKRRGPALALAGWGVTLTAALVVGGLGIWQIDEQIYTTDAAAENYWDALAAGNGAEVLSQFASLPEDAENTSGDSDSADDDAGSDDTDGEGTDAEDTDQDENDGEAQSRGPSAGPLALALDAEDDDTGGEDDTGGDEDTAEEDSGAQEETDGDSDDQADAQETESPDADLEETDPQDGEDAQDADQEQESLDEDTEDEVEDDGGSEDTGSDETQHPEDVEDRLPAGSTDAVLLQGEALSYSADLMEELSISGQSSGAALTFTVEDTEHQTDLPLTRVGSTWLFFDDWQVSEEALTTVDLSVPGSEAGGIAQVDINGEPVNLSEESAELAAFLPSVIDVGVDSEWLSGSARQVVVDSEEDHQIDIDLEASDAAAQTLYDEVEEFLNSCADQEVLMPTGCPMGVETSNTIEDAETIEWTMPDPEDISLTFDSDGWNVIGSSGLTATVEFDSLDYFDGDQLEESHDVTFSLDIEVGASGEELIVSVADPDTVE